MKRLKLWALASVFLLTLTISAQAPERVDVASVEKIKAEAARQSQAIEIARNLTNVYGARLTNSPGIKAAGEYARKKLVEWKLDDVRLETWNFGNGWTNEKFSVKVASDPALSLLAYPKAWTRGTSGPITAEAVEAVITTEADFEKLRGKLRGKFVLILAPPPSPPAATTAQNQLKRYTDEELLAMVNPSAPPAPQAATGPQPASPSPGTPAAPEAETGFFAWVENALSAPPAQPAGPVRQTPRAAAITRDRVTTFYFQEGVAAMIEPGPVRNGAIFAVTATGEPNAWKKDTQTSKVPPQVVIAADQYGKIMEMVQKASSPVMLEVDIRNTYLTTDLNSFNVVADIKGTDKADELVVLGAHLDSWHLGKGATDNAAGVAVVMEAVRILKALGLPMRRTVRLGLWTGEEEGLLGSRAFIDKYFINRPIAQTKAGHSKLSAYFNVDNGTGAIRGVYMQGNTAINPIFEAFMGPLRSLGVTTLSARSVGGTDHLSFDNAGLPGFQFIQDPIEYDSRTHHSNLDTFERLLGEDLAKNAAIVASFVYLTANRDEPLPRKPLPRSIRPAGSPVP